MAVDHLSLYQLTIEDGTAFGDRYSRGKLGGLPEDDLSADMYTLTQDLCDTAGFGGYEVSNHAKIGEESRHNLIYWRYGDYAGIGPGAHGRLTLDGHRYATEALRQPGAWLNAVEKTGNGEKPKDLVSGPDQACEFLMMGLRLREGIDMKRYKILSGSSLSSHKINDLTNMGFISVTNDRLRTTDRGRVLLNAVIRELLPD
jgi:oxygen-independent coproporphyrinogen-3 oxidase